MSTVNIIKSALFGDSTVPDIQDRNRIEDIVDMYPVAVFNALAEKLAKGKMILSVGAVDQSIAKERGDGNSTVLPT